MAKNNTSPNELDLLSEEFHTFPPNTFKSNPIQVLNTTFTFESVITKLNQPVGKGVTVYLYHKGLGTLIAKTETDADSKIYIPNLSKHNEYMVVAVDPKDIYNSVIFDVTFELNVNLKNNIRLKYYSIYDVPNLQKLYAYWNTFADQRVDPNLLFFISNPNFKDDLDLIWGMNGTVKTTTIKDIRTFVLSNSGEYIYLYHNPVPPREQFTFSAYIYIESNNRNITTDNNIFKQATQSFYVDSNLKLNYKNTDNTNTVNIVSTTSVTLDDWNHVSISFDGSKLYLFLNGILEAWSANSLGMSYANSAFTLGEGFKGFITQPLMTSDCKYTEDFEFLLKAFSYKPQVYSDPSDTIAEYVRLKLTSNRLGYGLRDEVNNISFNSGVKNTNFTSLNTKSRMVAYTKNPNMIIGNKNFCMEMKIKVRSVTDNYPKLVLNHNEVWTTNSWEFAINHISYPNTYSFHSYNVGAWAFNYPTILNELVDLAIIREGVNLKFYVNGFLDRTINVGTNSFDNATINTFLAIAYYINSNFYDFKLTVGHSRYTGNYQPKQLDWVDADIALDQYKIINMPFKQTLTDSQFVFTFVPYNVTLSTAVSINNTKSAYFKNAKIVSSQKLLVTNEKFSMEMFYQPKTESLSGVASIISVAGAFRLGSNSGVLSFFNGTAWEDSTYSLDDTKLNHIVLQRDGTTIKLLADGNLVLTTTYTVPTGIKTITIGCFNDTEYIDGYINNFIVYKNVNKYSDTYTVPLEDPVILPPEAAEPEIVVTNYTTAALDFEQQYTDRILTTTWSVGGSTANIVSENKLFGNNSFETNNIGDCITLPYNHITSSSTPYTIDFYMLHKAGTKGSSRTDDGISLFSKNTSGDRYLCLGDTRMIGWTLPHVKKYTKYWNNEINHYTLTYDGAASRLFVNGKLEAIGGGSMDFNSGSDPLRFGYHYVSGYDNWAFGTKGIWDNFNIHQGIATVVRDKDPNEDFLVCDLAFDGTNGSQIFIDNAPNKPTWGLGGVSPSSYIRLTSNESSPKFKTGYSYFYKNYYNSSCIKSTNVDLNFGTIDWTLSFEFIKADDATYSIFLSSAVTNYAVDKGKIFYFCVMGSSYTSIPALQRKLAFFNEENLGTQSVKDSVIANPYSTPNVLVSKTTILTGVPYKADIVFKNGVMNLYINGKFDTSIPFDMPINLSPEGLGTTIGGIPFSEEAGLNGYINYVKAYKGVAIVPEDTSQTIELDFQDNVLDNYSNSTWTASGLTYDSVNSARGSAAYFDSSSDYLEVTNDNVKFEDKDFLLQYDIKTTTLDTSVAEFLSYDRAHTSSDMFFIFNNSSLGGVRGIGISSYPNRTNQGIEVINNTYYFEKYFRKSGSIISKRNDVIYDTINTNLNFDKTNKLRIGNTTSAFGSGSSLNGFKGYLDNFKTVKNYTKVEIIDRPAICIPFQKSSNNIGFSNLTISNPGSPTYATIDNVKCIKFEPGKYVTANINNIFNLGNNSDFYIEFDFYIDAYTSHWQRIFELSSSFDVTFRPNTSPSGLYWGGTQIIPLASFVYKKWYKFIIKRKNSALTVILDSEEYPQSNVNIVNNSTVYFGTGSYNTSSDNLNGYLANFIMFIGTGDKPTTFDSRAVLDLDFKPTGKSYLFKDKNNNVILHPSNITQRNYLNSKYCCTFNGTNQCILTGKNPLFSFGTDDFVMEFKFKPISTTNWNILISNGNTTFGDAAYCYIGMSPNNGTNPNQMYATINSSALQIIHPQQIDTNNINTVVFYKEGNTYTLVVNGQAVSSTVTTIPNFDLNNNNNTIIGRTNHNSGSNTHWFTGEMYSVRVFRNTSDLTLLD